MAVYAKEYGYFFNSQNNDRTYDAGSFETWLKPFFVPGVFAGTLQVLAQDTPDMTVKVTAGYANLDGKPARWEDENTLELATASGVYGRIDTIVLRRDDTNRQITLDVVTGSASSNPQPTPPQRTSDMFELILAEIYVGVGVTAITQSVISDKRPDTDVCGYVMTTVESPDFSELYAQFEAQAEEYFEDEAADFMDWFNHMKDQLDEDAAGHLQLEIDDINEAIGDVPEGKDLQVEIEDLQSEVDTLEEGLAIVVDGDKTVHVGGAAIGDYVLVKNSTIEDILDGGYTAAKTIPENTVIDKTYLTPCSKGIANSLSEHLASLPRKNEVAQNLPVNGGFSTANENNYTTPGVTTVFASRTIAGVAVNRWFTLIIAGSTASHLDQILISNGILFKRYYEGGTWSSWSGGAI